MNEPQHALPPVANDAVGNIVAHPDGYYWVLENGLWQFGPFGTHAEARADLQRVLNETGLEPEPLSEAERTLGLSEWIDRDSGTLAQPPQVRLEEH